MTRVRARVIVVAGPSGSGKSRLCGRTGLPVLRLDDFYRDGSDPDLPRLDLGGRSIVEWDDRAAWRLEEAVETIGRLCAEGCAEVPVYDLAHDRRVGHQLLDLAGSPLFVAEGIFAHEVVRGCSARGVLTAAYCLRQPPLVTFWRRLVRDLRERRKPAYVLLRRGLHLLRGERALVSRAVALGCDPVGPDEALARIRML